MQIDHRQASAGPTVGAFEAMSRQTTFTVLASIVAFGAGLRLYGLDDQSLWMDEVASLHDARVFSQGGLESLSKVDHVAPLHAVVLWLTSLLGGAGEVGARLPSVIAGILSIPLMYALGVRLFKSQQIGLLSAALFAISPFAIWYAQEARMYSMLIMMTCAYVVVAWPIVERDLRVGEWIALTLITAIGLYTHHYLALVPMAFGVFLLFAVGLRVKRTWIWAATQLVALAAFAPWLVMTLSGGQPAGGTSKPAMLLWIPHTFFSFATGLTLGPTPSEIRMQGAYQALTSHAVSLGLTGLALFGVGAIAIWRALQSPSRSAAIWCLVWIAAPLLAAVVATGFTNISYNSRYVASAFPPFLLIAAFAFVEARHSRWAQLATGILIACMFWSLLNLYTNPSYAREDVRELAQYARSNLTGKQVLVVANTRINPILRHYGLVIPANSIEVSPDAMPQSLDAATDKIRALNASDDIEIWLVEYRPWETDQQRTLRTLLDTRAVLSSERDWTGVSVRSYRLRPR